MTIVKPARVVALHGIESTGKSVLAERLASELGAAWVGEYGRDYCAAHGTDCSRADLEHIAEAQQALIAAAAQGADLVITDTDWLMTRAWHRMMIGSEMASPAYPVADLYLHLAADVPWVDDGLRLYADADQQRRFDTLCRAELVAAGVRWVSVGGTWNERHAAALAAIAALSGVDA